LKRVETRIATLEKQVFRLEGKRLIAEEPSKAEYKRSLVLQILSLKKAGKTYKQIADLFNEEGTHTVSGRGKWSATSIMNLLNTKKK
jgi:hypothetical protein